MASRQVTFLIKANAQQFSKALGMAQSKLRRFAWRTERLGRSMTQNISTPLAIMGGLSIKAAADFESSFADIRKTVDATEQQFGSISNEMRGLAKMIPTSVNELNRLGGVAGQLGIEAENIVGFTEVLAKLADTTDVVGEEGALQLARFMNVMGTAEGDIDRIGSTIVDLGNNFAAMESEIIETATALAPLGNSIGLTEQQVLAFSATIAASGGKIRAAGTAFQKTANTMKQAVIEGNADLQTFAQTAGMTSSAFQQAFQEDAAGALQSFLEGLKRVQEEGGSVATVLEQVGLADQRLIREFGKVLGNLDDLNKALPLANVAFRENTALTEEAQKRYRTLWSQAKILWNNLVDLGITIGNTLTPFIRELIDATKGVIQAMQGMDERTRNIAIAIAGIGIAIGPVLTGIALLSSALAAISLPLTAVVVAVGAGVGLIIKHWDTIVAYFQGGAGSQMWDNLVDTAKSTFKILKDVFKSVVSAIERIWNLFGKEIIGILSGAFKIIKGILQTALNGFMILLDVFTLRFITDWQGFLDDTKERFGKVFGEGGALSTIFDGFFTGFLSRAGQMDTLFGGLVIDENGIRWVTDTTEALKKQEQQILWTKEALALYAEAMGMPIKQGKKKDGEDPVISPTIGGMGDLQKKVKEIMAGVQDELNNAAKFAKFPEIFGDATDSRLSALKSAMQALKDAGVSPLSAAFQKLKGIYDSFKDSIGTAEVATVGVSAAVDTSGLEKMKVVLEDTRTVAQKALGETQKKFTDFSKKLSSEISPAIVNGLFNIGTAFLENSVAALAAGTSFADVGINFLRTLADLAIRVGKIAIAVGAGIQAIQVALSSLNPFVAIAAGAALIALGAAAKGALKAAGSAPATGVSGGGSLSGTTSPSLSSADSTRVFLSNISNNSQSAFQSAMERALSNAQWRVSGGDLQMVINNSSSSYR